MKRAFFGFLSLGVTLLAGCGGSSSGSPAAGGGEITYGSFSTRGTLTQPMVSTTQGSVGVTALAGDFSLIRFRDTSPKNQESQIFLSPGQTAIRSMDFEGANLSPLFSDPSAFTTGIRRGPSGRTYFTNGVNFLSLPYGGAVPTSFSVPIPIQSFDVSPSEGRVVIIRGDASSAIIQFYTLPAGTSVNWVWSLPAFGAGNAAFVDDGNTVAFTFLGSINLFNPVAQSTRLTVSSPGDGILASDRALTTLVHVGATANPQLTFYAIRPNPALATGVQLDAVDTVPTGLPAIRSVSFTAEGDALLLLSSTGDLYKFDLNTRFAFLVRSRAAGEPVYAHVAAGPVTTDRVFVQTATSPFGATAAGILQAQSADVTQGFVLWDATTRSTSRVAVEADSTATSVFRIEADRITRLSLTNDKSYRLVSGMPGGLTVNGALVTVDARTGQISSVSPYSQTRGDRPRARIEGDRVILEGRVEAVYDGGGKNLAPSGAQRVEIAGPTVRVR